MREKVSTTLLTERERGFRPMALHKASLTSWFLRLYTTGFSRGVITVYVTEM